MSAEPYTTPEELEAAHASFSDPPRYPATVEGANRVLAYMDHVKRLLATARLALSRPAPTEAEEALRRIVGTDGMRVGKSAGHLIGIARAALLSGAPQQESRE